MPGSVDGDGDGAGIQAAYAQGMQFQAMMDAMLSGAIASAAVRDDGAGAGGRVFSVFGLDLVALPAGVFPEVTSGADVPAMLHGAIDSMGGSDSVVASAAAAAEHKIAAVAPALAKLPSDVASAALRGAAADPVVHAHIGSMLSDASGQMAAAAADAATRKRAEVGAGAGSSESEGAAIKAGHDAAGQTALRSLDFGSVIDAMLKQTLERAAQPEAAAHPGPGPGPVDVSLDAAFAEAIASMQPTIQRATDQYSRDLATATAATAPPSAPSDDIGVD